MVLWLMMQVKYKINKNVVFSDVGEEWGNLMENRDDDDDDEG